MKTTKQIYLLMEKKGRELAALAEGLDKIIVTEETLRNMFDGKETDSVNASSILEKGVSVQVGDKIKDYLIFEVMDREDGSRSYIFAAKSPDACVGDESRINKVKRIFFFTAPKKEGFFLV